MKEILKGIPASIGEAEGVIRIIEKTEELEKFKQGEILVTKMTNPIFVIAMRKAAAIITDFGGRGSHAAIVSRELGVPCIVGTEKATILLKNGMKVKVNGESGVIYEL